jgi:SpoVK/Ycf46/Vps4 family AAA+-type ATPase
LILAEPVMNQLKNFAAEARQRSALLAGRERRRVFGGSAHLSALFTGPPGLGKSMSAKVIARELGLDCLIVDTSALISKYIGESAKNFTSLFTLASELPCVLVFEEADAALGTRVKQETSNDKHHNADTGHLLQLMEQHEGVVILSTNKRGNIDSAFMRRLRYIVEYRRPSQKEAERMWENMLRVAGLSAKARHKLIPSLAAAHDMTPAQIKGAAITAAYRALARGEPVKPADVEEGIRFEFQKDGKLVSAVAGTGAMEAQRG